MNDLITTNDLCNKIKVTRTTIERYRREGMPYKKIGKMVRFDIDEVSTWINEKNTKK